MADVVVRPYGETSRPPNLAGTSVSAYAVTAGAFTLDLIDLGARVVSLSMPDRNGDIGPVCLSMPTLADWEDVTRNKYFGDTIGRYANRIAGARFELDGVGYALAANEGPNHLHGGPGGFGRRVWSAMPFTNGAAAGVQFTYTSRHLEEGYPGDVHVTCRTTLASDGTLTFEYTATTDRPTIVNLTNHTYWNLAGTGSIDDHLLTVDADRYLPVDHMAIPLPEAPAPVASTAFDVRAERRIGDMTAALRAAGGTGLDHCYLPNPRALREAEPHVAVRDERSGRTMTVWTDQPGVQIYTGQHLGGSGFEPYAGLCLEAQQLPNAPNRPDFPSPVLRPGETYRATTVIRLGVDG